MTVQSKTQVKSYFTRGAKPTQAEFGDLVDSYQDYSAILERINFLASAGQSGFIDVQSPVSADFQPYGTIGLQVLQSQTATSAKQVLNIGAAVSAEFATTAQAIAGAVDGISMSPVLTRNAIQAWALTSADFSTTAQAIAGTDDTTVMSPVLTKNAIASLNTNGLTLISAVTAVAVSAVAFTNIDATYDEYEIHMTDVVPGTSGTFVYLRTSTNNGSSYDSGASDYAYSIFGYENITSRIDGGAAINQIGLAIRALDTSANKGLNGTFRIYNPAGTTYHKAVMIDTVGYAAGGVMRTSGVGYRLSTANIDALQVFMLAGTLSGTFRIYGVKK